MLFAAWDEERRDGGCREPFELEAGEPFA